MKKIKDTSPKPLKAIPSIPPLNSPPRVPSINQVTPEMTQDRINRLNRLETMESLTIHNRTKGLTDEQILNEFNLDLLVYIEALKKKWGIVDVNPLVTSTNAETRQEAMKEFNIALDKMWFIVMLSDIEQGD